MTTESYPGIYQKIESLRALAVLIEGEKLCEIRKLYLQAYALLAKEIAEYYNPQEEVTHLEEVTPPKKRGRKPKVKEEALPPPPPEVEVEAPFPPGESELDPNPASVEHALVFDSDCLITDFPRIMDLHLVTDEWIESSEISPVVLANSCTSHGDHPFFKGAPSFISYLPQDRWAFYMAGLFDINMAELFDTTETNRLARAKRNILDLIDAQRLDECEHSGGPNMDFVLSTIDPQTRMPREPVTVPDDPDTISELRAGKAMEFVEALGEGAENGKALLRFMTRFGIHKDLIADMEEILAAHNDPDERNPDVRF